MARVLCINDHPLYAEMLAMMLIKQGGHEVKTMIVPFDLGVVRDFRPDVILLNLVRKTEALGTPIHDFDSQVEGARALKALRETGDASAYPLIITGMAVTEAELPKDVQYCAFVEVPQNLDLLMQVIAQTAAAKPEDIAPR